MSARLFAALELPAPVRDALGAFGRALDDIDPARDAVREVAAPTRAIRSAGTPASAVFVSFE